jgi:hypothetical protein
MPRKPDLYAIPMSTFPREPIDCDGASALERAQSAGSAVRDLTGPAPKIAIVQIVACIDTALPAGAAPITSDGGPEFHFKLEGHLFHPPAAARLGSPYYVAPRPEPEPVTLSAEERAAYVAGERERLAAQILGYREMAFGGNRYDDAIAELERGLAELDAFEAAGASDAATSSALTPNDPAPVDDDTQDDQPDEDFAPLPSLEDRQAAAERARLRMREATGRD